MTDWETVFREAGLKVERAKKHIADLELIERKFLEAEERPYEVFIEHDANGGDDLLKVKAVARLPDSYALTLGDAIHNLRTSLDYVMNDIEFVHTGKRTPYTKFPASYPTKQSLEGAINGGLKEKAPEQVLTFIVDTVQPYFGGDGAYIHHLHRLDIEDKHRLLIAKAELNFVNGITIEDDAGIEHAIDTWLVRDDRIASHPIKGNRSAKVKNQGQASYRILFSDDQPLGIGFLPVIPTLRHLTDLIEAIIHEIKFTFLLSQLGI